MSLSSPYTTDFREEPVRQHQQQPYLSKGQRRRRRTQEMKQELLQYQQQQPPDQKQEPKEPDQQPPQGQQEQNKVEDHLERHERQDRLSTLLDKMIPELKTRLQELEKEAEELQRLEEYDRQLMKIREERRQLEDAEDRICQEQTQLLRNLRQTRHG
ncbi:hypothetical protein BGZ91_001546 [Linnemannia elongata]|nr:hypothetical protein BGZ91_001546 [Linnemannia elongata]KAG0054170.1 hypothetical protein BGZ90_006036 [Linnemannia elongata]